MKEKEKKSLLKQQAELTGYVEVETESLKIKCKMMMKKIKTIFFQRKL
jgi:hypothetical protein